MTKYRITEDGLGKFHVQELTKGGLWDEAYGVSFDTLAEAEQRAGYLIEKAKPHKVIKEYEV